MEKTGTCPVLYSLWLCPILRLNFSIWEGEGWKSAYRDWIQWWWPSFYWSCCLGKECHTFCLPFSSPFHTRHCCWCPATNKRSMTGTGVSQLQSGRHLFSRGGRGQDIEVTTWTRVWYKGDGGSLMLAARTQGNSKDRFPILTVKLPFFFLYRQLKAWPTWVQDRLAGQPPLWQKLPQS